MKLPYAGRTCPRQHLKHIGIGPKVQELYRFVRSICKKYLTYALLKCYLFSYRYISICTGLLYFHGSIDLHVPTQNKGWRYITVLLLITSLHAIPSQVLRHIDESLEFDRGCLFEMQILSPHCIYLHTIFAHTTTSKRNIKSMHTFFV